MAGVDKCLQFETEQECQQWYSDAAEYWQAVPATVNGVLGGFEHLNARDVAASLDFLTPFLAVGGGAGSVGCTYALDCGAGIGRVSKDLLLPIFTKVDLVEQNKKFLDKAPEHLGEYAAKVGNYYAEGLQTFTPEAGDLLAFFNRCKSGLNCNGLIFVKENVAKRKSAVDDDDHSVTRTLTAFRKIFSDAGLRILQEKNQPYFPKENFPVKMFALSV